jgi:hypothetical protein
VSTIEEHRHEPGPEHWWNESWYFDFAEDDGSFGGYVRVGLVPNQDTCWYLLHLVTPGRTVRIDDKAAPLPTDDGLTVHGFTHIGSDGTWRISGTGTGYELAPEQVLAGDQGRPVEVSVDLTWTTDGTPFAYDVTTRYEIPCLVSGSVTVDGVARAVESVEGQRDHSWGVRDWKASGWCWASARLADGSRLHVTDVVFPEFRFTTGYLDDVTVTDVERSESFDDRGLPTTARLVVQPMGLVVEVTALAHGPTLITDQGTTWPFQRSLARYRTETGDGIGWIEWNRPDTRA